ncbi:MAG: hypothetical protein ACRC46_07795 [Thermoguttaceae bacterium]
MKLRSFTLFVLALFVVAFCVASFYETTAQQNPTVPNPVVERKLTVRTPLDSARWLADFVTVQDPATGKHYRHTIIVDPETRHIVTYVEDLAAGTIKLQTSRDIRVDLEIEAFNNADPLPQEIEKTIRQMRQGQ